jgi:hypothetical protein
MGHSWSYTLCDRHSMCPLRLCVTPNILDKLPNLGTEVYWRWLVFFDLCFCGYTSHRHTSHNFPDSTELTSNQSETPYTYYSIQLTSIPYIQLHIIRIRIILFKYTIYELWCRINLSKEISRLAELTNYWSSTIIIPQGDAFLNISSAAQGKLSVTPDGATNQPNVYPKGQSPSLYRFDPDIFGENDWQKLKGMLSKVGCVSGCKLTTHFSFPSHSPSKQSHTWKATYYISCTHAIKGQFSSSSIFNDDDIGPINVVTEQIKRIKPTVPWKVTWKYVLYLYNFIYKFTCNNLDTTHPYCTTSYKRFVI